MSSAFRINTRNRHGDTYPYNRCICPSGVRNRPSPICSTKPRDARPNHFCDTHRFRAIHGTITTTNTAAHNTIFRHRSRGKATNTYTSNTGANITTAYCVNAPTATANALTINAPLIHQAERCARCQRSAFNKPYAVNNTSTAVQHVGNPDTACSNNDWQNKNKNTLNTATRSSNNSRASKYITAIAATKKNHPINITIRSARCADTPPASTPTNAIGIAITNGYIGGDHNSGTSTGRCGDNANFPVASRWYKSNGRITRVT